MSADAPSCCAKSTAAIAERNKMKLYEYPLLYFSAGGHKIERADIDAAFLLERFAGSVKGEGDRHGFKIDFNAGLRLSVPPGEWRVVIKDGDADYVAFDGMVSAQTLVSIEKYFVAWQAEVFKGGEKVFEHKFNPAGREVYFNCFVNALGEKVMFLPYIKSFGEKYNCRPVFVSANKVFDPILRHYYPNIRTQSVDDGLRDDAYAAYDMGAFHSVRAWAPWSARQIPYDLICESLIGISGVSRYQFAPFIERPIEEPYVCIAAQASHLGKCWLYPGGWDTVVAYLKNLGYRVFCIDQYREVTEGDYVVRMPEAAEDMTGDHSLMERIAILGYADFFIGLPSGLSWLADACGIKTIIISGFTMPYSEFPAQGRVINRLVCHGCYNDPEADWKRQGCPRHSGTDREYECTRKITPAQVIRAIDHVRSSDNPKPMIF